MHPSNPCLYLGLDQPLQLLAKKVFHGHLVGLHLLEIFEQSANAGWAYKRCYRAGKDVCGKVRDHREKTSSETHARH